MVETTLQHPPDCIHFQGRDHQENFQFYFRQHWIRLAWPFFHTLLWTLVIFGAGAFIFFGVEVADATTRHGILFAFYLILAWVHIRFLMRVYTYFLYVIVVTDRKVHRVKKTLFSIDDHQGMDIWTFQEVMKMQHGIIQNIFGYGSLILEAQDSELRLHFVPHISKIHDRLSQIRERAREQMMRQPVSKREGS